MFARDKILHFLAGASTATVVGLWIGLEYGLVAAMIVGCLKEIWDFFSDGDSDAMDLLVTVFGGLLAYSILWTALG